MLLCFVQRRKPEPVATLDQDATLVASEKREALYCYEGYHAYQPLTTYWAEQRLVVSSEFRGGNDPAGREQLRVLKEAISLLPEGVETVRLRSDTVIYQKELLRYCAEGADDRLGRIEFAVGVDMTLAFKLHSAMQRLALGPAWQGKRLKAVRFGLINLPGRLVAHARTLFLKLSQAHPALGMTLRFRRNVLALVAPAPPG